MANEHILVVDDDQILAEYLKAGLSEDGYHAVSATSGAQAVDESKRDFFNVVIVDLQLPDIQGIDLMRSLASRYPEICFIISTGNATVSSAVEALKLGAYDYIIKPFDPEHLKLVIKRGLEKQRLVLHNRELVARLAKEKTKLEIIMDTYTKMSGIYRLEDLADFVTDKAIQIVEAEKASFFLLDEETNELVLKGARGIERDKVSWRVKVGELVSGWVAQSGETLLVRNIDEDMRFKRHDRSYRTKSFVSVPLKIDTHVIGVMNVTDKLAGIEVFTEEDLKYLLLLTHQAVAQIENIRLCETLGSLAVTDALTGVFNHRYFQEQLNVEVLRAHRYKHPISLMMFDIDHFKTYNDKYGHLEGDRILREVAGAIRANLRQVDILCRYGGDEFVVILPYTDSGGAQVVAEKIRAMVCKMCYAKGAEAESVPVSVSGGVASYRHGMERDELISSADKALYIAKAAGRNKIYVSPE